MKPYQVFIAKPAADDLQALAQYITEELFEPAAAKKMVGKIKEAVLSLGGFPVMHRSWMKDLWRKVSASWLWITISCFM